MKKGKTIQIVIKGLTIAFLFTVLLLLLLAFLMLKLQWETSKLELAILAVYVLATFAGGWITGHAAEKKKFLYGCFVGILYFLLLLAVSVMGESEVPVSVTAGTAAFFLCAAGGMLGGMLA